MSNPTAAASTAKPRGIGWSIGAIVLGAIAILTWAFYGVYDSMTTADQNATLAALKDSSRVILLLTLAIATVAGIFALIGVLRNSPKVPAWLGAIVGVGSLFFSAIYGGGLVT